MIVNTTLSLLHLDGKLKPNNLKMNLNKGWIENNIGVEGESKLSESLKINTTLTELHLFGNRNTTIDKNEL